MGNFFVYNIHKLESAMQLNNFEDVISETIITRSVRMNLWHVPLQIGLSCTPDKYSRKHF